MARKLIIEYETPEMKVCQVEFDRTPTFYEEDEWIIFSKGVLANREIPYNRILEIYVMETIFSAYEAGIKALAEVEE